MGAELGNVVFIVWRESIEALLVIAILNGWLTKQADPLAARRGRTYLWAGVAAGIACSLALAGALALFGELVSGDTRQIFQIVMELVAVALIVQMVFWMKRHGRTLQRDIETSLTDAAASAKWWAVFVLAFIAVAREGTETVVFLSGTLSAAHESLSFSRVGTCALGLGAAVATYAVLQFGSRFLSWRTFFRVTEVMLLLLAGSLLISATDSLMTLDLIPQLSHRLWDSSGMLPDTGRIGGLIAALTGYRARPDLTEVLILAGYWGSMLWLLSRKKPTPVRAT